MALDPLLLGILACPQDKGPLLYFSDEDALCNPRLRRRYSIRDGIPDMLIDDAEDVEGAEHDRLTSKAARRVSGPISRPPLGRSLKVPVLDSDGMFELAAGFPEQVEQAFADSRSLPGLPRREEIENVVVVGMGGSGIAGDVLRAVASPLLPVPVTVVKNYECPHFVTSPRLCLRSRARAAPRRQ